MLLASLLNTGIDKDQWLAALNQIALPNDSFKVIIEQVQMFVSSKMEKFNASSQANQICENFV